MNYKKNKNIYLKILKFNKLNIIYYKHRNIKFLKIIKSIISLFFIMIKSKIIYFFYYITNF